MPTHTLSHLFARSHTHTHSLNVPTRTRRGTSSLTSDGKRRLFAAGSYTVDLVPLNPFAAEGNMQSTFPDNDWGARIARVATSDVTTRVAEATFEVWARGIPLRPVPFPTNTEGEELCHGTILGTSQIDGVTFPDRKQFSERPLRMQSLLAMRRWLKVRNVTVTKARRTDYFGTYECVMSVTCYYWYPLPPV